MEHKPVIPIDVPETLECERCQKGDRDECTLKRIDHPANSVDWAESYSRQSYQIFECPECGCLWGCRFQYDAGTGHDDRWKRFGVVAFSQVKRHY